MRVLGIDPGSRKLGFAVVEEVKSVTRLLECGVISVPAQLPLGDRLVLLADQLNSVIVRMKPQHYSIEKVFMGKNVDSAFVLGHARGVAMMVCHRNHMRGAEYSTKSAKKMLTGNGGATKEQVKYFVETLFKTQVSSLDATDAVALAVCGLRSLELQVLMNNQGVGL